MNLSYRGNFIKWSKLVLTVLILTILCSCKTETKISNKTKISRERNSMTHIEELFVEVEKQIFSTLENLPAPAGQVYACSFWLFYCDYTKINIPHFAYNTTENVSQDAKWSPPNWKNDGVGEMFVALDSLYSEINNHMVNKSDDEWERLIEYQWNFYSTLSMKLNNSNIEEIPLKHWDLSNDFVVGILEEREGIEVFRYLAEKSIGNQRATELGII